MSNAEVKNVLVLADLNRELAHLQEAMEKQFAAIVRFVQLREAKGSAKDMMEQIGRDKKLCQLLVTYEEKSELSGMVKVVHNIRMKQARRRSHRHNADYFASPDLGGLKR